MTNHAKLLHDSPWRGVFHLTGGVGFLSELLGTAGASRTVLEAKVPYAAGSLAELLGGQPDQACSGPTARAMAMAAFQRALQLVAASDQPAAAGDIFGFGATASLATDRPKRGPCRAHIAMQTLAYSCHGSFPLSGDRPTQEAALEEHSWRMLLQSLAVEAPSGMTAAERETREIRCAAEGRRDRAPGMTAAERGTREKEQVELAQAQAPHRHNSSERERLQEGRVERVQAPTPWRKLIVGTSRAVPTDHDGKLLFPGAFNPLHDGHRRMMAIAEAKTGLTGAYELSVENIDKPLLDYAEIQRRLDQFERPLWLTRLPTFVEKAAQFPGATFIVGIDTLVRVADQRYYGSKARLNQALAALAKGQARFLVFGRVRNGAFQGLDEMQLPQALLDLCSAVGETEFRADISSTELRGK